MISLSADLMGMDFDFVCISVQFIGESWSLKKWVIKFYSLDEPVDISPWDTIVESLEDWGSIKDKISTCPTRMVPQNAMKKTFEKRRNSH